MERLPDASLSEAENKGRIEAFRKQMKNITPKERKSIEAEIRKAYQKEKPGQKKESLEDIWG